MRLGWFMAAILQGGIDAGCCKQAWLLKNSLFVPISQNLGDRKCLGDPRKSILGLPDAIVFSSILRERVFQQPQAITLIDPSQPKKGVLSVIAMLRQLPPRMTGQCNLSHGGRKEMEGIVHA
jgi:hypothetical protein